MTDKGWICLAVVLFFIALMSIVFGLWDIGVELRLIGKRLGETNDKLRQIDYAHTRVANIIANKIDDVYKTLFSDAEVTIWRNDREGDDDDQC